MDIYTIGHSNYSVERLIDMLRHYNIDCVIDTRGIPYSKYNIQFDKETIRYTLTKAGFIYLFMATEFADKRDTKVSYIEEGYADFEKVIEEEDFKRGVERLKDGCNKGYRIALLGAMQDPIRCHRSILLGKALREEGFNVMHIMDDYLTKDQDYIEERILDKYFPDRNQITIDALLGNEKTREDLIKEAYKLANREIGIRVENLTDKKN